MSRRKSQISVEYLILSGFIILIILTLAFYIYTLTKQGVYGSVNVNKMNLFGNGMVKNAKQVYYLGLYSQKKVVLDVPDGVEEMFIFNIDIAGEKYYYIGIFTEVDGVLQKYYYQSDIPLFMDTSYTSATGHDVDECGTCEFFDFKDNTMRPGDKEFLFETKLDSAGEVFVEVKPVYD